MIYALWSAGQAIHGYFCSFPSRVHFSTFSDKHGGYLVTVPPHHNFLKKLYIVRTFYSNSSLHDIGLGQDCGASIVCVNIQYFCCESAGTELIRFNIVNIMVTDVLSPCVTRSSAAMILTVKKVGTYLIWGKNQLLVSWQCGGTTYMGNNTQFRPLKNYSWKKAKFHEAENSWPR